MTRNALPRAALARLRDALAPGGQVVRVRPLRGGISSSVHLVRLETATGQRQAVVVRRYGQDSHHTDDQAASEREFRLLEALAESSFPSPRPLLLDATGGIFGVPTIVMNRLSGRVLLNPRNVEDYIAQIARTLLDLHRLRVSGLEFLPDQRDVVGETLAEGPPTADDPICFTKRRNDVRPLCIHEGPNSGRRGVLDVCLSLSGDGAEWDGVCRWGWGRGFCR